MSKSHVGELNLVYSALLKDATYAFPELKASFERDLERLLRHVEQRGIHVYMVDLPAVAKHLTRCLDIGQFSLSGLALTKSVPFKGPAPAFLGGLYQLIFDVTGKLKSDYNTEAIFFLRQILICSKKVELPCSADNVEDEIRDFVALDSTLPEPEGFWSAVSPTSQDAIAEYHGFRESAMYAARIREGYEGCKETSNPLLSIVMRNLDIVSGFLVSALGPYNPSEWSFKHGPGAISERTGKSNKYCWSNWSPRLENVYPIADYGFHSYSAWADRCYADSHLSRAGRRSPDLGSEEPESRLVAVPKTLTVPRLIAAEPSEHQWCQQNLWHYFCHRSKVTWLSEFVRFTDQTRNQELCVRGSRDGSLATVDLSAASDRVTCHAVGQMYRSNPPLLLALQATRTRVVRQEITKAVVEKTTLRKFSTMGSACTFPIESLMFLAITLSATLAVRRKEVSLQNILALKEEVAVFGDDIIVPSDSRALLFESLGVLHFKVNAAKSFWTGRFRESCGVDAMGGVTLTPAYLTGSNDNGPEHIASTVAVRNNFHGRFLLNTARQIATALQGVTIPLVAMDSGVFGLKTFV